jgi:hypothetical protein
MPSTLTMPETPELPGSESVLAKIRPAMVASTPTASTVRQKAKTAARNGTAANNPTKLARVGSTSSTAEMTASSTMAAPRPARDSGLSGPRPVAKLAMVVGQQHA